MLFMRTILALSLFAFALAVPLALPQGDGLTVRIAGAFGLIGPICAF
jgi:hypothetical protein